VDDPSRARPLIQPDVPDGTGDRLAIPAGLDASLVLVRHGESELILQGRFQGRLETPLSGLGRRQAERVAGRLADPAAPPPLPVPDGAPRAIVHSPLSRAAETATSIARARSEESLLRPDDRFAEIGQGEWEGRLASEIAERDGDRLAAWRTRPTETWAPGGEPLSSVRSRVMAGLGEVLDELAAAGRPASPMASPVRGYRDEPATQPWSILVAHDGVFKVALLSLFDLPLDRFWMWTTELCAVSVVELRAGRPVVRALNLTEHLAGLSDEGATEREAEERARLGAL
jgi:broad specificity phosphatase PhoE